MKQYIYSKGSLLMTAALCTFSLSLFTSCMDGDWDAPSSYENAQAAYGNNDLKETNVVTIEQLKTDYAAVISGGTQEQVTKDMQIKGVVTGNDAGGNIYKSVFIEDATGSIQLSINRSNTSVYLPVGQTVLVELNGLYVGSYGKQPQIGGGSYVSGNYVNLSRMEQAVWMQHFKLVGKTDGTLETVTPIEVKAVATGSSVRIIRLDDGTALNLEKDCGRLVTLRDIELDEADGTTTYATATATTNRSFKDINSSALALRTSNYADFALAVMPTGKLDITGILGRYQNGWQLLLRTEADVTASKGEVNVPEGPKSEPTGDGTAAKPYNVAAVTAYTMGLAADVQSAEVYATGIITEVSDIDITGTYGNATYLIADDSAGETGTFQIYRGYGLNGEKFNAAGATIIKKGDVVVIKGKVVNYKGNTPQFAQGSTIVKINDEGGNDTPDTPSESNVTKAIDGTVITLTNTTVTASANTIAIDLSAQGWSNAAEVTNVTADDGTTINFSVGEGSTTPKYYDGTKGIRMYAKNTITITGASKAIAKVVLECDSYSGTDYVGNPELFGSASGNSMTIVNEHSQASGGTQLRVKAITITYAN